MLGAECCDLGLAPRLMALALRRSRNADIAGWVIGDHADLHRILHQATKRFQPTLSSVRLFDLFQDRNHVTLFEQLHWTIAAWRAESFDDVSPIVLRRRRE